MTGLNSAMKEDTASEPLEPEVLPPEGKEPPPRTNRKHAERAFGPIVAGLILDLADFSTLGPLGFVLGAGIGWWLAGIFELPSQHRLLIALGAGAYCMIPMTGLIPVATLIGAGIRFLAD